jgi:hypothetical protein
MITAIALTCYLASLVSVIAARSDIRLSRDSELAASGYCALAAALFAAAGTFLIS